MKYFLYLVTFITFMAIRVHAESITITASVAPQLQVTQAPSNALQPVVSQATQVLQPTYFSNDATLQQPVLEWSTVLQGVQSGALKLQ